MPNLLKVPDYSRKSVQRREARKEKILTLVANIEPPHIAYNLRTCRRLLAKRLQSVIPNGQPEEIHSLTSDFCRVAELLLRLAKIPQAPPGKLALGRLAAPIDLEPDSEPMTVTEMVAAAGAESETESEPFE